MRLLAGREYVWQGRELGYNRAWPTDQIWFYYADKRKFQKAFQNAFNDFLVEMGYINKISSDVKIKDNGEAMTYYFKKNMLVEAANVIFPRVRDGIVLGRNPKKTWRSAWQLSPYKRDFEERFWEAWEYSVPRKSHSIRKYVQIGLSDRYEYTEDEVRDEIIEGTMVRNATLLNPKRRREYSKLVDEVIGDFFEY